MGDRIHSDRVQRAIQDYNEQHPESKIDNQVTPEELKDSRNFVIKFWDKIGKTGQVIALVAGILTGLTTIKPYAEDVWVFVADFINSVQVTRSNTNRIGSLEKSNEINMSITKSSLHPFFHTNPDGSEVKLYQTKPIHGKVMTYHFVDSLHMPLVANENLESGFWYTIDGTGNYSEIKGKIITQ